METSFFMRGLIIGFSIAATVGPMSILCIQRTLSRGYLYGLVSGLGVATADAVYGSVAGFGLTVIATFLVSQQGWIRVIGGLFLIYLGLKTILTKPAGRAGRPQGSPLHVDDVGPQHVGAELAPAPEATASANNFLGAYASTLLLTLTNPLTILSFAAIFAGIGVVGASNGYLSAMLVVLGVFLGSAFWWCLLTGGINLLRGRFTPQWLLWINRISGAIITLFGVLVLVSLKW